MLTFFLSAFVGACYQVYSEMKANDKARLEYCVVYANMLANPNKTESIVVHVSWIDHITLTPRLKLEVGEDTLTITGPASDIAPIYRKMNRF
jgi:hypothetical protein